MDFEKGKTKRTLLTEEEKRERKNARQKEYEKETNFAAINKYNKEHTKSYAIRFFMVSEQDLIEYLEAQPNKAGYIKRLIREDMERSKNGIPLTEILT